ncbi:C-GCAxxG-C-C family protein [Candidatus Bipolaricaulota bacterium]|nr:C-GCAxxG-C-C family protein [Candidatus Bipolaricaulota bacterium]
MDAKKAGLEQILMPIRKAQYGSLPFVAASPEKILDAIAQTAFNSLGVYGNCCRSTLWAVQIHLRKEESATLRASSVLAGGICGTGETCGAVLGGMIAIGEALGSDDFRDLGAYELANAKVREFLDQIRTRYTSSRCHAIQTAVMGWCCDDPSKAARWTQEGGPLACAGVCATAAHKAAAIILACQASATT